MKCRFSLFLSEKGGRDCVGSPHDCQATRSRRTHFWFMRLEERRDEDDDEELCVGVHLCCRHNACVIMRLVFGLFIMLAPRLARTTNIFERTQLIAEG